MKWFSLVRDHPIYIIVGIVVATASVTWQISARVHATPTLAMSAIVPRCAPLASAGLSLEAGCTEIKQVGFEKPHWVVDCRLVNRAAEVIDYNGTFDAAPSRLRWSCPFAEGCRVITIMSSEDLRFEDDRAIRFDFLNSGEVHSFQIWCDSEPTLGCKVDARARGVLMREPAKE